MPVFAIFETSLRVGDSFADDEERAWFSEHEKEKTELFSEIPTGNSIELIRNQFNKYFSNPDIINMYRGLRFKIENGKNESSRLYMQGGGCGVYTQYFIKEVPHSN